MSSNNRVLIVDDEANARGALAEILVDEGYLVASAEDGRAALHEYEAFAPHAVVTDLRMPNLGGLQLIALLRQRSVNLVILAVSADGSAQSRTTAMRHGADGYLTKPIDIDHLFRTLAITIHKVRTWTGE